MFLDFATSWEAVCDAVPDLDAVIQGQTRLTYAEFDDAASRFAASLERAGVAEGSQIGLYLHNGPEYLIAQFGAFKHRCCAVNVNYRYLDDELVYLLTNSDSVALVYNSSLSETVARVRDRLVDIKLFLEVDDRGGDMLDRDAEFHQVVGSHEPQRRKTRDGSDLYMLYTGGTTGMPKGVMYRQGEFTERLYGNFATVGLTIPGPTTIEGIAPFVAAMAEHGREISIPCCPLMHGTGMWVGAMPPLLAGGAVALLESRHFDAHEVWSLTQREGVTRIVIVGDPFARPMLRALEEREASGQPYDTSSVRSIISAGAIWSAEIKDGIRARVPGRLVDALGSTEGGTYAVSNADHDHGTETAHFSLAPGTKLIDENRQVVTKAGQKGLLASTTTAFGYYKDPEKSERTFLAIEGQNYVITGDWATIEHDGTVTLLGRGSNCINTGGEKVYPEEVEEAIKRHVDVDDCLVVGLPDERFGQRVVALVGSPSRSLSEGELRDFLLHSLAHFKIPKSIHVMASVQRAPNGKADYVWAKQRAMELSSSPS